MVDVLFSVYIYWHYYSIYAAYCTSICCTYSSWFESIYLSCVIHLTEPPHTLSPHPSFSFAKVLWWGFATAWLASAFVTISSAHGNGNFAYLEIVDVRRFFPFFSFLFF